MSNNKSILTEIQEELGRVVRPILNDKDTYVGTMLMLTVNQPDPDGNCRRLLEFIRANPNAGYDEIMDKADEIVGIEDPFAGED